VSTVESLFGWALDEDVEVCPGAAFGICERRAQLESWRARQAAEALLTSKSPPVSTSTIPASLTTTDRPTRKPRAPPILSPAAPVRHEERETPAGAS
jgi:hypothetical protein